MKFDQSLPLIYVLVLVTSKFHQKLQLKFQSSNVRFHCGRGGGGGDSAMAATVKLK